MPIILPRALARGKILQWV